jgi:hypothetical protein
MDVTCHEISRGWQACQPRAMASVSVRIPEHRGQESGGEFDQNQLSWILCPVYVVTTIEACACLIHPDSRRYGCPAMDGLYKGTDGGPRVAVFVCCDFLPSKLPIKPSNRLDCHLPNSIRYFTKSVTYIARLTNDYSSCQVGRRHNYVRLCLHPTVALDKFVKHQAKRRCRGALTWNVLRQAACHTSRFLHYSSGRHSGGYNNAGLDGVIS